MAKMKINYLIDTHILIWYGEGDRRLNPSIFDEMRKPSSKVFISHATFWEITIKKALRKLEFSAPVSRFRDLATEYSFQIFRFNHYERLELLPHHHNDPFDRMLIAQAIAEDFTIITQDKKFATYEHQVKILWN
ncbi:type II toxin-antitoxin system VapC family toxin [Persicitalea sp.]|uniref:type II toxin-antitoxin system VapC family toxin n=1 Tax=Persicitalea sp. TaxID=3100273 RepID=UPI003593DFAE